MSDTPLSAGGELDGAWLQRLVHQAAKEAATEALAESRSAAKKGRSDKGRGDPAIGSATQQAREEMNMSLDEAAKSANIHPTFWGKIERGERGMSLATFARMATVLPTWWRHEVIYQASRWAE